MQKGFGIKLTGTPPVVLNFQDDVLECFFEDGSTRVHVIHIKAIDLADNKGKYLLTIHLNNNDLFIWVDAKQIVPVRELIDQLKQAMAASRS